jgi:Ca2+-transporting ATPase
LSANFGEVLVFEVAIVAGLGMPLAVIHVLLVNLITDGLPALALARDPASARTMSSPPRRETRLFDRRAWAALASIGLLVGGVTLAAFAAGRAFGSDSAQTMAFATLALSELALVFALRSPTAHAWQLPRNGWLVAGVVGSAVLVAAIVYLPFSHDVFATVALGRSEALTATALALVPLALVEAAKAPAQRQAPPKDVEAPAARLAQVAR